MCDAINNSFFCSPYCVYVPNWRQTNELIVMNGFRLINQANQAIRKFANTSVIDN